MNKILSTVLLAWLGTSASVFYAATSFLNVSYDPTREFYQEIQ
jgi:sulfate transport system substrate-binding protein